MIKEVLLVALGGGVGSALRYMVSVWTRKAATADFPWATFIVNILGCLLIGLLIAWLGKQQGSQQLRLLLITGFCGGYTTFSAFALENVHLLQAGHYFTAIIYTLVSIIAGILAVITAIYLFNLFA